MKCKVLLTLLVGVVSILLYTIIDSGTSYSYMQVSLDNRSKSIDILSKLVIEGSRNYRQKDILVTLRRMNRDAFIVIEKDLIKIDELEFIFLNGKLKNIKY